MRGCLNLLWKDILFNLRTLGKNPGVAILALLALALGIGANTAIFSVVYSLMFRPLPGATKAEELVSIVLTDAKSLPYSPSYAAYQDFRALNTVFADAAATTVVDAQLRIGNRTPERIMFPMVTGNFFTMLGVKMAAGRTFNSVESGRQGAGNVVVLAYRFWQKQFSGNPDVIGSELKLNGTAFTIIGVTSQEFHGTDALMLQPIYIPMTAGDAIIPGFSKDLLTHTRNGDFVFLGRLRPGVKLEQAQAAVNVKAALLAKQYPEAHAGQRAIVYPEPRTRMEPAAAQYMPPIAIIFMTLVGLVLLAACANVASLLYARASGRQKELAIRLALGAGRGRILQQLLTESLLISLLGAAAGVLLARWLTNLLSSIRFATDIPIDFNFSLNSTILGYALILGVASGILAGLMPGLRISNTNLVSSLKEGGRTSQRGSARQRLRDALVVTQVASSLVLLVCAGLFLRSALKASTQDLGIQTRGRLVMAMDTELLRYDEARSRTFYRQLLERVRSLPGVESVSLGRFLPIGFRNAGYEVFIEGRAKQKDQADYGMFNIVSPEYFKTIGMPLLQGRAFTDSDNRESRRVAIINEAMAARYWPGQNAMGHRFRFDTEKNDPVEIVGIAKTAKYVLPAERPTPAFYLPFDQNYRSDMILHVHTLRDPKQMIAAVHAAVLAIDPEMPVWDTRTLEEHIRNGKMRLYDVGAGLIGAFGLIALALSAVGLYGVMAFLVNQRTHEIGVRMALGSSQGSVLRLILLNGMKKTAIGLVLGAPVAILATRAMHYLLVGVSATDPLTLSSAFVFLTGITLISTLAPAWRATRVDPLIALHNE